MPGSGISSWMPLQYALASVWHPSSQDSVDTEEDLDNMMDFFAVPNDRPFDRRMRTALS
jgi:hypothetical protein